MGHGGGYTYRLCPMPSGGKKDLTEECFQKTVLNAVGNHTAVFQDGTRASFQAVRTTEGTYPAGSQWTRNPIPACKGPGGGSLQVRATNALDISSHRQLVLIDIQMS